MSKVSRNDGKGKQIFCGIDLHERKMMVGTAVDRGPVTYRELGTDEAGVGALVEWLRGLKRMHGGSEVRTAYEASGSGFWLADELAGAGLGVAVLAPTHLPTSPHQRSRKTDKRDVERILEVLRGHELAGNGLPSVWVPPAAVRDDREVVRCRLRLREDLGRVKNEIGGFLRRHRVKMPEGLRTRWSRRHLLWLRSLSSGFAAGALRSICGVGMLTAMVFLTELGELGRFSSRRKLGSYLGLAPRSWESGETADRKGHISKLGPSRVRKVLNQAAWSRVRHNAEARAWYQARTPRGKFKTKTITAQMRRLGILMWHTALAAA